jgi:putative protease
VKSDRVTLLELLAPARNAEFGKAAINHGADAVYIGAPSFGARASASNSIREIEKLLHYAHLFHVKVYATINTILYDSEFEDVSKIIYSLYNAGIDGIIIQDMGILELDLPPVPLIASTQTHNNSADKVSLFESLGFKRVILARELSIPEIKDIKSKTSIELEAFVHGALCVSYSGQCYMSEAICGRSGNRGVCAQPCRSSYDLIDNNGKIIVQNKHLLSQLDLNLSLYMDDLIDAGITSFKIEGRLKDLSYVKNITSFYRQKLDFIMEGNHGYKKVSAGTVYHQFLPDPEKSFNRGFTTYFIKGRKEKTGSPNTQKSLGKRVGYVTSIGKGWITSDFNGFNNNDGICFFNHKDELHGTLVQKVEEIRIYLKELDDIIVGTELYRNHDQKFEKLLAGDVACRKLGVVFSLLEYGNCFALEAIDEDGNRAVFVQDAKKEIALNKEKAKESIINQLSRLGETIFEARDVFINTQEMYFIPIGVINEMRRNVMDLLVKTRIDEYRPERILLRKDSKYITQEHLSYLYNVSNQYSRRFYTKLGAKSIDIAFELTQNRLKKQVMVTKHCIKYQFDACPRYQKSKNIWVEPLYLKDNHHIYSLEFDCKNCEMKVIFEK